MAPDLNCEVNSYLDGVENSESVIRRFNPKDPNHYSVDQETEEIRLRSGFLIWDEIEKPDSDFNNGVGASVNRLEYLTALGFEPSTVIEKPNYVALGKAEVSDLRQVNNTEVIADPVPHDIHGTACVEATHGLIALSSTVSKSQRRKIASRVASRFSKYEL